MMVQPSFIRPGSDLHRACIELYQRHRDRGEGSGRCATCGGQTPCLVRRDAALVIRSAGEDPRWYDGQLSSAQAPNPAAAQPAVARHPSIATPGVTGYAVGGRGRRANVPYVEYER
jgi:hypothetical protein